MSDIVCYLESKRILSPVCIKNGNTQSAIAIFIIILLASKVSTVLATDENSKDTVFSSHVFKADFFKIKTLKTIILKYKTIFISY